MPRKILLTVLILSLIIELALSCGIFFAKDMVSKQFGVAMNADTEFLSFIVGWLCLFISLILMYTIYLLWNKNPDFASLAYIMGYFWMAIGIAIYVAFKKPDNLVIDTFKGMLIVGLTMWYQRVTPPVRRR